MRNLFMKDEGESPIPGKRFNAEQPVPAFTAHVLSHPQQPRSNRALRRAGVAYIYAPAAFPKRHGISRCCNRRTYISEAGTCRKHFLSGDGPVDEVTW